MDGNHSARPLAKVIQFPAPHRPVLTFKQYMSDSLKGKAALLLAMYGPIVPFFMNENILVKASAVFTYLSTVCAFRACQKQPVRRAFAIIAASSFMGAGLGYGVGHLAIRAAKNISEAAAEQQRNLDALPVVAKGGSITVTGAQLCPSIEADTVIMSNQKVYSPLGSRDKPVALVDCSKP